MHKEKVKYYDGKGKPQECEADTFDTIVHMNKGKKHALRDIERLLKEEELNKQQGFKPAKAIPHNLDKSGFGL